MKIKSTKVTTKKYIIVKDRVELYKDFALNLLYHIDHYYVDFDSIHEDSDINNHLNINVC